MHLARPTQRIEFVHKGTDLTTLPEECQWRIRLISVQFAILKTRVTVVSSVDPQISQAFFPDRSSALTLGHFSPFFTQCAMNFAAEGALQVPSVFSSLNTDYRRGCHEPSSASG